MKKISTLIFAAALAVPAFAQHNVKISLYDYKIEDVNGVSVRMPDETKYMGYVWQNISYDGSAKRYTMTDFLGYEKFNFSFYVEQPETPAPFAPERQRFIVETEYNDADTPARAERNAYSYLYGTAASSRTVMSSYYAEEKAISSSARMSAIMQDRNRAAFQSKMFIVDSNTGYIINQPRVYVNNGQATTGSNDKNYNLSNSYALLEGINYKIYLDVLIYGRTAKNGSELDYNEEDSGENAEGFQWGRHYYLTFEYPAMLFGLDGVEEIGVDENAPVEYFNLQGIKVENPEAGLYIRRQGSKVEKVVLK